MASITEDGTEPVSAAETTTTRESAERDWGVFGNLTARLWASEEHAVASNANAARRAQSQALDLPGRQWEPESTPVTDHPVTGGAGGPIGEGPDRFITITAA